MTDQQTIIQFVLSKGFSLDDTPALRREVPMNAPFLPGVPIEGFKKEGFSARATEALFDHFHGAGSARPLIQNLIDQARTQAALQNSPNAQPSPKLAPTPQTVEKALSALQVAEKSYNSAASEKELMLDIFFGGMETRAVNIANVHAFPKRMKSIRTKPLKQKGPSVTGYFSFGELVVEEPKDDSDDDGAPRRRTANSEEDEEEEEEEEEPEADPWGLVTTPEKRGPNEMDFTQAYVSLMKLYRFYLEQDANSNSSQSVLFYKFKNFVEPTLDVLLYEVDYKKLLTAPPLIYIELCNAQVKWNRGNFQRVVCEVISSCPTLLSHCFLIIVALDKKADFARWLFQTVPLTRALVFAVEAVFLEKAVENKEILKIIGDSGNIAIGISNLSAALDAEWKAAGLNFLNCNSTNLLNHHLAIGGNFEGQNAAIFPKFVLVKNCKGPFKISYVCREGEDRYQVRSAPDHTSTPVATLVTTHRKLEDNLKRLVAPIQPINILRISGSPIRDPVQLRANQAARARFAGSMGRGSPQMNRGGMNRGMNRGGFSTGRGGTNMNHGNPTSRPATFSSPPVTGARAMLAMMSRGGNEGGFPRFR